MFDKSRLNNVFSREMSGIDVIGPGSVNIVCNLAFVNTVTDILEDIQTVVDENLNENGDGRSLGGLKLINDGAPIRVRRASVITGNYKCFNLKDNTRCTDCD